MRRFFQFIARLDAHERVFIAFGLAAVAAVSLHRDQIWAWALAAYDVFAAVTILLMVVTILLTPASEIRKIAKVQDVGRTIVFFVVVVAACAALFAVGFIIQNGKSGAGPHFGLHLALALATVILSWLLVHTVFGFRYAHRFYGDLDKKNCGTGLQFPEEDEPNYRDFAYFSFVIGMTCQVSDVQVSTRPMRQLVLIHGILSFAFNTVILALTVNTVSSLRS